MDIMQTFEELNNIESHRSEPYETYYENIGITQAQKDNRIELARELGDIFLMIYVLVNQGNHNIQVLTDTLADRYIEAVSRFRESDDELRDHIMKVSEEIIVVTVEKAEKPYFTSYDRARYDAENESETVWNHFDFEDAVAAGMETKTWNTMMDERVRPTHWILEGKTIQIDEPFEVGEYLMMYPKDTSFDAGPEEICGCRCWLTFE